MESRTLLAGTPVGAMSTFGFTGYNQAEQTLAVNPSNGNVLAAWTENATDTFRRLHVQLYDSSLQPASSEVVLGDATHAVQSGLSIATNATGKSVVAFVQDDPFYTGAYGLQRFDSSGQPLGATMKFPIEGDNAGAAPVVKLDANGQIYLCITRQDSSAIGFGLKTEVLRFGWDGTPIGSPVLVANQQYTDPEADLAVEPDGRFAVTWRDQMYSWEASKLKLREFDANGQPDWRVFEIWGTDNWHAPKLGVLPETPNDPTDPRYVVGTEGQFLFWLDSNGNTVRRYEPFGHHGYAINSISVQPNGNTAIAFDDGSIRIRSFNPRGYATTEVWAAFTNDVQQRGAPALGFQLGGTLVVGWFRWQASGQGGSIVAQRFTPSPTVAPPKVSLAVLNVDTKPHRFQLQFDSPMSDSFTSGLFTVYRIAPGSPQYISSSLFQTQYNNSTRTATLTYTGSGGTLSVGRYRISIEDAQLFNTSGIALDGDRDNQPGGVFSFQSSYLPGDADRNGVVDFLDLLTLAQNYGQANRNFATGNFDYSADGKVDFTDLLILSQYYGQAMALGQAGKSDAVQAGTPYSPSLFRFVPNGDRRRGRIVL